MEDKTNSQPANFLFNWFLQSSYRIPLFEIKDKVLHQSRFAPDYFLLMISSIIICTLGLLLDAPAVIIGGMIISPLMWPLMHIALGIATADKKILFGGINVFVVSIIISLITAALITYVSPIKIVTQEILSRSSPTIIDLIIALTTGIIASIALFHRRISESLAGVAIASSLMPPLCVGGIGLIVGNLTVSGGSLLLFATNIVAIIFVATVIFTLLGFEEKDHELRKKSFYFLIVTLIIISLPLMFLYNNYVFRLRAFDTTKKTLTTYFHTLSEDINVENINISYSAGIDPSQLTVYADVLLPNNMSLDYTQRESLVKLLQEKLSKQVDIQLRILPTASFISFEKQRNGEIQKILAEAFREELTRLHPNAEMDTFAVEIENNSVIIDTTVFVDINKPITEEQKETIESKLSNRIQNTVYINMLMLPRLHLVSGEIVENSEIKKNIEFYIKVKYPSADIKELIVQKQAEENNYEVVIELYTDEKTKIDEKDFQELKQQLREKYNAFFVFEIRLIEQEKLEL